MKAFRLAILLCLIASTSWSQVRITSVDPNTNEVVLTNMGGGMQDVANWWLCNFPTYNEINVLTTVGSTMMMPGGTLTITFPALAGADGECGLYNVGSQFSNPSAMEDYMEWGSPGHFRETVAVTAGVWCAGEFVSGLAPYTFTGTMVDFCAQYWTATPATYDITFQVDMNNVCVSPDGVHLAGNFGSAGYPEWDPAGIALSDGDADGVYDVTLTLSEGSSHSYKYVNGNAWGQDEGNIPAPCGFDNNRTYTVPSSDDTVPLHCYASCDPCGAVNYNLTLQVDMSDEVVDAMGVHVMGSFNAWDAAADAMVDQGSGIWAVTLSIPAAESVEYKFVNGNVAGNAETVPMICGVDDGNGSYNRNIDCLGGDLTLDPVCFSACEACASSLVNVTFQVDMSDAGANPAGVFIVGSLQSPPWVAGADQLTDMGSNIFAITVQLATGTTVEYKYLNGPLFANEETVPAACGVDNGFGGFNRAWTVGAADETVPLHCFSSCLPCSTPPVNVTFQVDMTNEVVSVDGVHVAGNFQGWDPAGTLMTDPDLDNIYTVTMPILPGTVLAYKFINGNDWLFEETVPGECQVGSNREYVVGGGDETIPVVCFGSCTACMNDINVTFQVDMNNEVVGPNGVHVAGDFQGWDAATTEMTDPDLDGVYTVIVPIMAGSTINYKFINGNDFVDAETVPGECEVFTNRQHALGAIDETIPLVCFSSCTVCDPPLVDVTFRVDMWQQTVAAEGVHLAGSMQAWDPAATPMTNLTFGIYEVTIQVPANSTQEYLFINGNDFVGQETMITVDCGTDNGLGGYNRELVVAESPLVLDVVCFDSCDDCMGCTNPFFSEFNPFAVGDDGSCSIVASPGCTYPDAENFDPIATDDDGSCTFDVSAACPGDLNEDGVINTIDLLGFLAVFGTSCL